MRWLPVRVYACWLPVSGKMCIRVDYRCKLPSVRVSVRVDYRCKLPSTPKKQNRHTQCVHEFVCVHVCVCVIFIYRLTIRHMHTPYTHTRAHTHTHTHTYTHTHIHTHSYTHTHLTLWRTPHTDTHTHFQCPHAHMNTLAGRRWPCICIYIHIRTHLDRTL